MGKLIFTAMLHSILRVFEIYKNTGTGGKLRFEKVIDQIQTIAGWESFLVI